MGYLRLHVAGRGTRDNCKMRIPEADIKKVLAALLPGSLTIMTLITYDIGRTEKMLNLVKEIRETVKDSKSATTIDEIG